MIGLLFCSFDCVKGCLVLWFVGFCWLRNMCLLCVLNCFAFRQGVWF